MSVTPIRPGLNVTPSSTALTGLMADTVQAFEQDEGVPTGAIVIVFDDNGDYRVGWDSRQSVLPANALVGIGLTALMQHRPCPHD